ncbi:MAG: head GIN domain-containing protein [Flavobacteriaceae bacterium]|jgi:hypothetical protein|tara:strand:- start:1505 stop:2176 length:672 start_codon:yes stop_codon:yes gene_type:complete
MKHLNLILFIVCTQLFSQTPITKTLGEFSELKVYDLINVELIKASENKIIISGANSNNINIIQKNSTLKIRMKLKYKFNGAETQVKIYYTDIDIIDANEGSFVFSKDIIKQYEIVLKAQEGSQISVKTETKQLIVKSVTGSTITTTGISENQDITIRTGGVYKGGSNTVENTDLSIKAGGEAAVKTTNVLDIKIFSGGDVHIYGTPKQLKQKKIFGGRIIFKD